MVKSAKFSADDAKGNQKVTSFFKKSSGTGPSASTRITRRRGAAAPTATPDPRPRSASQAAPATRSCRLAETSDSASTLTPSSSPDPTLSSAADSSSLTVIPDANMQSPNAKEDVMECVSPSVRRSSRKARPPPSPRPHSASPTKQPALALNTSPLSKRSEKKPVILPSRPRPLTHTLSSTPDAPRSHRSAPKSPHKRRKISQYVPDDEVPASRSEEKEMTPPPLVKMLGKRTLVIPLWKSSPVSSALPELIPEPQDSPMADGDGQWKIEADGVIRTSTPPPPSSPLTTLNSPVVLDIAASIAAIKAKVLTATFSSEEEVPRGEVPRELSPDSSDEDVDIFATLSKPDRSQKIKSPLAATQSSSRYGLRDRQKSASRSVTASTTTKSRSRTKTVDPIAFMLREKRAAQRRGYDADALMDEHDRSSNPYTDNEGDADDEMVDEPGRAFGTATPASDLPPSRLRTPERMSELDEGLQMLGGSESKAVGLMLEEDLASKRSELDHARAGVAFWEDSHGFVDSGSHTPSGTLPQLVVELPELSTTARNLVKTVNEGDHTQVIRNLELGCLPWMTDLELGFVLPWCAETIVSPDSDPEVVQVVLDRLPLDLPAINFTSVPLLSAILEALVQLKPSRFVLAAMDWDVSAKAARDPGAEGDARDGAVCRLAEFLTICAQQSVVPPSDVMDLIVLMVLIGMDPGTTKGNALGIRTAIESLGKLVAASQEPVLGKRLAVWVSQLDLANQVHFFTIFTGSIPSSIMRIVRWVAHSLLVKEAAEYSALPALEPLETLLRSSDGPFAIAKDTDFEPFYLNVEIMSFALSSVEDYVQEEKRAARTRSLRLQSESSSGIMSIQDALDRLHGRIQDTRAADLKRSRTKAALLSLSLRLRHQHSDFMKSGEGNGKPRKISEWFNSKPNA